MPVGESRQLPIAVTTGCPAGIGPEIVLRAVVDIGTEDAIQPMVIGDWRSFQARWKRLAAHGLPGCVPEPGAPLFRVIGSKDPLPADGAVFVDLECGIGEIRPGKPTDRGARASATFIEHAARGALAGRYAAMATAPIHKASLMDAGFEYPGHTEFLGAITGAPLSVMFFVAGNLRVALATVHVPLARVAALITQDRVSGVLRVVATGLRDDFGIPAPRIAVCGLNPHAGENGRIGKEDHDVLAPAINNLRREGVNVSGPLPADTLLARAIKGEFDAVTAMYHDQGLVAVKTHAPLGAVNITLGLPIVRTSVDHGTAHDIAGRGTASAKPMAAAIRLAAEIAWRRTASQARSAQDSTDGPRPSPGD